MLDNGDICEEIGTSDKFGVISDRIGILIEMFLSAS